MSNGPSGSGAEAPRGAVVLLAMVILLWGANWPIMKVGLTLITPLWFAAGRLILGALTLVVILLVVQGRLRVPVRADWPIVLSVGLGQMALHLMLNNMALLVVDAGRSAILVYTVSLWVTPLAVIVLGERLTGPKLGGLLLGLSGVAVMFNPLTFDWADRPAVTGNALLILSSMVWAAVMIHIRYHRWRQPPLELMPWQLLLGAASMAAAALLVEGAPLDRAVGGAVDWTWELVLVMAYNGPVASAFCYWAMVTAMQKLGAITTSIGSLGVPVTGLLLSAFFLGESVDTMKLLGLGLILSGLVLVTVAGARGAVRRKAA